MLGFGELPSRILMSSFPVLVLGRRHTRLVADFCCAAKLRNKSTGKNSERAQFQYCAYGRDSWRARKRASITQNEMKSGEGYSK